MAVEQFANEAQTTLASAVSSSDGFILVDDPGAFPATAQFRIRIDDELLLVTDPSGGSTWLVTRGIEGTAAAEHLVNATVTHVLTAGALEQLKVDVSDADLLDGLHADATGAADAHVVATDANGDATVVDLTVSGGLNLGTATGAGAGDIHISGSIGIGTNSPFNLLHVRSSAVTDADSHADDLLVLERNGNANLNFIASSTGNSGFLFSDDVRARGIFRYLHATDAMELWTAGANRLVVNSAGRVLIGTTSDDGVNRLQVNGSVKATYAELNWLQILDGVAAPATVAGWARIYVDSADGDLKIKFGDGTVKTIVTD